MAQFSNIKKSFIKQADGSIKVTMEIIVQPTATDRVINIQPDPNKAGKSICQRVFASVELDQPILFRLDGEEIALRVRESTWNGETKSYDKPRIDILGKTEVVVIPPKGRVVKTKTAAKVEEIDVPSF